MNDNSILPMLEAILFAVGEPIEIKKIAEATEIDENEIISGIRLLQAETEKENRGLCIVTMDSRVQLVTKTLYADDIRKVLETRKNAPLSPAAFEVLAVVAYNQPVTKSFIEQVRGVDCSGVLATLVQKNLIEEKGRLDLPGRPLLYGTTDVFLRSFGVSSLSELPELPVKEVQVSMEEAIDEQEMKNVKIPQEV